MIEVIGKLKVVAVTTLCMILTATSTFAAVPDKKVIVNQVGNLAKRNMEVRSMRGQITEINGDMVTIQNKDNADDKIVLIIRWNTEILNGRNGRGVELSRLSVGDELTAYYSPISTRSLPPQSRAYALVMGNSEQDGFYMEVAQVEKNKNGTTILNSNGDMYVTIPEEVNEEAKDLKVGDKVLVWYETMTLSLPGQATATKAVIL